MTEAAIRVQNLGKLYRLGNHSQVTFPTLRDALSNVFRVPNRNPWRTDPHRSQRGIWALKDASFEVQHGEVVGLIGRNGAGKSTLLKILSRVTEPSEGRARLRGRLGSLLEVGTGFHPELTGWENIYLSGAILGMTKTEIVSKFDEIVAFAEIERFIDTPVKHYSSGMYVRLAFAVAAHLDPEILFVDEVLAVGDAQFQKKCLGKMGDVSRQGRTVLFVSHNMAAVQSLCGRAIWLHEGRIQQDGRTDQVVADYLRTQATSLSEQVWDDVRSAPGNDKVRLHRACVRPASGKPTDSISMRTPLVIEFDYWNLIPDTQLNLSVHLYNAQGIVIFNTTSVNESNWDGRPFPAGLFHSECLVPGDLLNAGVHRVELLIVKDRGVILHHADDVLTFDVSDAAELRDGWYGTWNGVIHPELAWKTELLDRTSTID